MFIYGGGASACTRNGYGTTSVSVQEVGTVQEVCSVQEVGTVQEVCSV